MRFIILVFCLFTSTVSAAPIGWRRIVYDGDRAISADATLYPEQTCKEMAKANNEAYKATAEALHSILKKQGPVVIRFSVRCDPII